MAKRKSRDQFETLNQEIPALISFAVLAVLFTATVAIVQKVMGYSSLFGY